METLLIPEGSVQIYTLDRGDFKPHDQVSLQQNTEVRATATHNLQDGTSYKMVISETVTGWVKASDLREPAAVA